MNYILYTFLAVSTATCVCSRTSVQWSPNLSSAETMLHKALPPAGIDMDYFGDSVERRLSPRTVEITDKERSTMDPDLSDNPIVVFINEPDVFEDYRMMKKRDQGKSSESDNTVSYKDFMQFLIQVDARLKQQKGQAINQQSHENIKLINFLRTFRRSNDEEYTDTSQTEEHGKKAKESIERPEKRKKKVSAERFSKPRVKVGGVGPKIDVPIQRLNFIRTPKPFIGKRGIYEEN